MKKIMCIAVTLIAAAVAQAISLSDARAQIGACIKDASTMSSVVKSLSAADQVAFLAEVNEAVSNMPGSNESRAAAFLNVNKAALKGAAKGNLATLLAEVYASVPPEALPVLSERFAEDLFSRTADPTKSYTDEQFRAIATSVMGKINERMASVENGAARSAMAIAMLTQASGGTPADLADKLIETLPEASREIARKEWIPAATGAQGAKNYEPILGAADAQTAAPVQAVVMRMSGPQTLDALLSNLVEGNELLPNFLANDFATSATDTIDTKLMEPLPAEPVGYQNQR